MTLAIKGFLELGDMRLEYRMIGPRPERRRPRAAARGARLRRRSGAASPVSLPRDRRGVFAYSRAGYGRSSPSQAAASGLVHARRGARRAPPRARSDRLPPRASASATATAHRLPRSMPAASRIIACAGSCLMAPHFFTEDMGIAEIARAKAAFEAGPLRAKLARCTPIPTTRSTTGAIRGSIPSSASGISAMRSRISACRS